MDSPSMKAWILAQVERDLDEVLPKAVIYGGNDLGIMGEAMVSIVLPGLKEQGIEPPDPATGLEMACAFYALGKCARLFGAYRRGASPSDDTWYDLTIYSLMARYVREFGEWEVTP